MFQLKVFIIKLMTIDTFTSSSITLSEVTCLEHEVRDDPMERSILVGKGLSSGCTYLVTFTNTYEVGYG